MEHLLNQINCCKNELQITTNNGSVHINTNNFDFTYIGLFGSTFLSHVIKRGAMNDIPQKLMILDAHINQYSNKIGGVTFINL